MPPPPTQPTSSSASSTVPPLRGIKRRLRDPSTEQQYHGVYELLSLMRAERGAFDPSFTERVTLTKALADLACPTKKAQATTATQNHATTTLVRCGSIYCLGILCCHRRVVDEASLLNTVPVMSTLISSFVLRHLSESYFPVLAGGTDDDATRIQFDRQALVVPYTPEVIPGDLAMADVTLADMRDEVELAADTLLSHSPSPDADQHPPSAPAQHPLSPGCSGLPLLRVALASLLWIHDTIKRSPSHHNLMRVFTTSGAYESLLSLHIAEGLPKRTTPTLHPLAKPKRSSSHYHHHHHRHKAALEAYEKELKVREEQTDKVASQVERERRVVHHASRIISHLVIDAVGVGDLMKLHAKRNGVMRRRSSSARGRVEEVEGEARAKAASRGIMHSIVHVPLSDYLLDCLRPPADLLVTTGGVPWPFFDLVGDCHGILFRVLTPVIKETLDKRVVEGKEEAARAERLASRMKEARCRKRDGRVDLRRRLKAAGQEGRCEWERLEMKGRRQAEEVERGLKEDVRARRRELAALLLVSGGGGGRWAGREGEEESSGSSSHGQQHQHHHHQHPPPSSSRRRLRSLQGHNGSVDSGGGGDGDEGKGGDGDGDDEELASSSLSPSSRHAKTTEKVMEAEERRMHREEQKRRREAENARRALQEAKERQELASRLYEGWLMNREDMHAREVDGEERRVRDAAVEVARVKAVRAVKEREEREEEREEREAQRLRRQAEAKKLDVFRREAAERRKEEESMQAELQEQLRAAMERWRREKLSRDVARREEERAEVDKCREREGRQLHSLHVEQQAAAATLEERRRAFRSEKDRLARRLHDGRFSRRTGEEGRLRFEEVGKTLAERKRQWVTQRLAEAASSGGGGGKGVVVISKATSSA